MAEADCQKYPSIPSNYISIAQLQDRWLKEKQKKQQEKEDPKNPVGQNNKKYQNHISHGCGKNLQKHQSGKSWREVGLIAKGPKVKEVKITAQVVEEGEKNKKKGYFGNRIARDGKQDMAKVSTIDVAVENSGIESSKGKHQWNGKNKEVKKVVVEVVGENKEDREILGQKCKFGYRGKKNSTRMGDGVGQVRDKADKSEHNAEKEEVLVAVKERINEKVRRGGAFRGYGDKEVEEVATICTVEVVEENKIDRQIAGQKRRVGFSRKTNSWRNMGDRVGEVSDKADSAEQSGKKRNAEKEKVSVDVKERTNEKVRVRGAFRPYGGKSKDVPLVDSDAGLKMNIERNLGDLSLSDRRYGHGRSRRYEPRKMLKQRDNSFVWVKKGESSNSNVTENETQGFLGGPAVGLGTGILSPIKGC